MVLKDGMMQCMKFYSFHVTSYYFYIAKNCPINSFTQLWYFRDVNGELPAYCIREVILFLMPLYTTDTISFTTSCTDEG